MSKQKERPLSIEVSNNFYHDALDHFQRFDVCWTTDKYQFYGRKSMHLKMYVDLLMTLECAFKSMIVYRVWNNLSGEALVCKVRNLGHRVRDMYELLVKESIELPLDDGQKHFLSLYIQECDLLPVHLRYRQDGMDMLDFNEDAYHETVGSESWLEKLAEIAKHIMEQQGLSLNKESRIVGASELFDEMISPRYNSYSKHDIHRSRSPVQLHEYFLK